MTGQPKSATASSWKRLAAPAVRQDFDIQRQFTKAEAEQLAAGLVPDSMDDKWFIYFADGWLNFHRSWTGAQIYGLCLVPDAKGVYASKAWVNRDKLQYKSSDIEYDGAVLQFLIDGLLLKKPGTAFPARENGTQTVPGLLQHHLVGRAFPEAQNERSE